MVEFKIHLDENIVQTFGYKQVSRELSVRLCKKMLLKAAAQDVLVDLKTIDLQNDKEWQTARRWAWQ